jgi:hypothetical protein
MCPADKTENHGEEEAAQKVAKHQKHHDKAAFNKAVKELK